MPKSSNSEWSDKKLLLKEEGEIVEWNIIRKIISYSLNDQMQLSL